MCPGTGSLCIIEEKKLQAAIRVRNAVSLLLTSLLLVRFHTMIASPPKDKATIKGNTDWIVKHACRWLIKQGDAGVFPIFGFTSSPKLDVSPLRISPKKVRIGSEGVISVDLRSLAKSEQKLAVDYRLQYVKANGGRSPKVFKWAEKTIAPGEVLHLSTKQSFADRTTRKHHPGKHALELVINGTVFGRVDFELFR